MIDLGRLCRRMRTFVVAAYAFGSDALKFGLRVDAAFGDIRYHEIVTRTVRAPSARACGSAVSGEVKNDVSWRIVTCLVEADAGDDVADAIVARVASVRIE